MRFLAQADDGARAACTPFKPIEASTKCVDLFCRCLGHGYSNRIATIMLEGKKPSFLFTAFIEVL